MLARRVLVISVMKPTDLNVAELATVTGGKGLAALGKLLGRAASTPEQALLDDLFRQAPPVRKFSSH